MRRHNSSTYGMVISNPADCRCRAMAYLRLTSEGSYRFYWNVITMTFGTAVRSGTIAADAGTSFTPQQIDDLIEARCLNAMTRS